jgi:Domain of unknown function (DUF4917)
MVTEGSAQDKRQAIDGNDYLSHAFRTLQAPDTAKPLVIFGCSLGPQDEHLVEALNVHTDRPIAVSMRPGRQQDLRRKQREVYGRLEAEQLYFFDATTHPLGAGDLAPVDGAGVVSF